MPFNDVSARDLQMRTSQWTAGMAIDTFAQRARARSGDIIATGTPAGVGFTREPPVRLRAGDRVEVEVEGLGVLSNPVIDERPPD